MELELGIARLDRTEQILVPGDRQIGIVSALEQQLVAAQVDRFLNLAEDLLEAQHIAVRRTDRPVERTEVAPRDAEIRVIDVAVDDVRDDALGMLAEANGVGEPSEQMRGR